MIQAESIRSQDIISDMYSMTKREFYGLHLKTM